MRRWSRAARPPHSPASAAPRTGSAPRAVAEAGAGKRGDDRQPRRLVLLRDDRGIGEPAGSRSLRASCSGSPRSAPGQDRIHRPGSPAVEHVGADVRRDPVEPGAKRRAPPRSRRRRAGANERLLHRVLRLRTATQASVRVARELGSGSSKPCSSSAGAGAVIKSLTSSIVPTENGTLLAQGLRPPTIELRATCRSRAGSSGR